MNLTDLKTKPTQELIDIAKEMGLDLPAVALAKRLYEAAIADGYGRSGTQALFRSLAERAGEQVEVEG